MLVLVLAFQCNINWKANMSIVEHLTTDPVANQGFRFSSKSVFLTFPRSDFHLALFIEHVQNLVTLTRWSICRERHQDGVYHVHAALFFRDKLMSRNPRFFDYVDPEGTVHHPHVGPIRSPAAARRYVQKDGDFIEDGWSASTERVSPNDVYRRAIEEETPDQALAIIRRDAPRDFIVYGFAIEARVRHVYTPTIPEYVPNPGYAYPNVPRAAFEWARRYLAADFPVDERPRSLCLVGPSRLGKTEWARSLGPHIYLNGYYMLDEIVVSGKNYIVCDDIKWERFPVPEAIIGCQKEFVLTDKYRKKLKIRDWRKPCIICWNDHNYPYEALRNDSFAEWFSENCLVVRCTERFF